MSAIYEESDGEGIPISNSGYIYIIVDSVFPDYIKIGRTINPIRRLQDYNCNKPFRTAEYLYLSKPIKNINAVEFVILQHLSIQYPTPNNICREWFKQTDTINIKKYIEGYLSFESEAINLFVYTVEMTRTDWKDGTRIKTQAGKEWYYSLVQGKILDVEIRIALEELANYKFNEKAK